MLRFEIDSVVDYTSTRPKLRRTNYERFFPTFKTQSVLDHALFFWMTFQTAGSGNTIPKSSSTMLKLMKPASWIRLTSRARKKKNTTVSDQPVQFQEMSLDEPPALDDPKAETVGKGQQQGTVPPVADREVQARRQEGLWGLKHSYGEKKTIVIII